MPRAGRPRPAARTCILKPLRYRVWLSKLERKFVLLIGEEQLGLFDKSEDAYRRGIELRVILPLLIKQVVPTEKTAFIPAMILGLMNAHP